MPTAVQGRPKNAQHATADADPDDALFPDPNRADAPSTNGSGVVPRVARREVWAEVDAAEYSGFQIKLWVNHPHSLHRRVVEVGWPQEETAAAMRRVFLEHNGWLDDAGEPYARPTEQAFWDAIPTRLAFLLLRRLNALVFDAPAPKPPEPRR